MIKKMSRADVYRDIAESETSKKMATTGGAAHRIKLSRARKLVVYVHFNCDISIVMSIKKLHEAACGDLKATLSM